MKEKIKARVMDATKIRRVLTRMCSEIIERNRDLKNVEIIGLKTRGLMLGGRIARMIKDMEGVKVPVGTLDITPYRDDLGQKEAPTRTPSRKDRRRELDKKDVILVDDVLMTGRTIRAAMDGVFDRGRARTVQLMVLIDRGHREVPIRPDFVGKVLPTSRREKARVFLKEIDGRDEVVIAEPVRNKLKKSREKA